MPKYDNRKNFRERGYTTTWSRLSRQWRKLHPLCVYCERMGKITPAEVVDHIEPLKGDMTRLLDATNLQSLCKTCHDSVKQSEEKQGYLRGASKDGIPIDSNHLWNKT